MSKNTRALNMSLSKCRNYKNNILFGGTNGFVSNAMIYGTKSNKSWRDIIAGGVGLPQDSYISSDRCIDVPIGFARYTSPIINPYEYGYIFMNGWYIAIPRFLRQEDIRRILHDISYYGPQVAGYARLGDTLVPSYLGPGDRMILAQTCLYND